MAPVDNYDGNGLGREVCRPSISDTTGGGGGGGGVREWWERTTLESKIARAFWSYRGTPYEYKGSRY